MSLLSLSLKKFDSDNGQRDGDHSKRKHHNGICIKSPEVKVVHDTLHSNLNDNHRQKVPKKMSKINTVIPNDVNEKPKFGLINITPYQPADRLLLRADKDVNMALLSFVVGNSSIKNSRSGRDIELDTLYHKALSLSSVTRTGLVLGFSIKEK